MKLKKRQFARLKDIAEAVNTNGVFGLTGIKLDKLIADIESVQKVKMVQEVPLNKTAAFLEVCAKYQEEFYANHLKQGEAMVAASTDETTTFKGGLRDAVEALSEPKIGDVGYFNLGSPSAPVVYGRMRNFTGNNYQDTHGNWYRGFSKTPPELR